MTRSRGREGHERRREGLDARARSGVHLGRRRVKALSRPPAGDALSGFIVKCGPLPPLLPTCCAAVACAPPALEGSLSLGGSPLDAGSPPMVFNERKKETKKRREEKASKQRKKKEKQGFPFCEEERRESLKLVFFFFFPFFLFFFFLVFAQARALSS